VKPVVYVVDVDTARVRNVGWAAQGASEAAAVEAAAALVRRRLAAMQRSAVVTVADGAPRLELSMPQVQPRDRELFTSWIAGLGLCELLLVADESDAAAGIDIEREQRRFAAWRTGYPGEPLARFHALDEEDGGPHPRIEWVETRFGTDAGDPLPLLLPERPEDCIGAGDFERAGPTHDSYGYPGIGVDLAGAREADFARVTSASTGRRLAILIEGRVRSAPTLNSVLGKTFLIEGRFTPEDVGHLTKTITGRAGPLRLVEAR
jgi:preprotein translocase subunit SecD